MMNCSERVRRNFDVYVEWNARNLVSSCFNWLCRNVKQSELSDPNCFCFGPFWLFEASPRLLMGWPLDTCQLASDLYFVCPIVSAQLYSIAIWSKCFVAAHWYVNIERPNMQTYVCLCHVITSPSNVASSYNLWLKRGHLPPSID